MNSTHQCVLNMLAMTNKYRVIHSILGEKSAPGNITYWRKKESGDEEYIFRVDVWSDSKQKFIETRWYPEVGTTPYFVNEYNDDTATMLELAVPNERG